MEIIFPVLVLEKDSGDMLKFESITEMQQYMERMDVENNEYAGWDAQGHPLSLGVQESTWLKVVPATSEVRTPGDLRDSLKLFAQSRNITLTDNDQQLAPVALYDAITARGGSRPRRVAGIFRTRK
jgi:hypothetical protein